MPWQMLLSQQVYLELSIYDACEGFRLFGI
ncbi:MAG: hypothetical protein RL061_1154, partial [Pseudomonadota bacterium]